MIPLRSRNVGFRLGLLLALSLGACAQPHFGPVGEPPAGPAAGERPDAPTAPSEPSATDPPPSPPTTPPLDGGTTPGSHQQPRPLPGPEPTFADVSYGPHARNVLDFWRAESDRPTPVVVFIHGGGFITGDKDHARLTESHRISRCLKNGASFASINYRYRTDATLDSILRDCARSIQFLRSRAEEWNLDRSRVAVYGTSAGGGAALWLAVRDDLADPKSTDPILRESTRLTVAGHLNSQATYDIEQWAEYLGIADDWLQVMSMGDDLEFYGVKKRSEVDSPAARKIRRDIDMLAYLDPDDPPLYIHNLNPDIPPLERSAVVHHPRHAAHLHAACEKVGLETALILGTTPRAQRPELLRFFMQRLR